MRRIDRRHHALLLVLVVGVVARIGYRLAGVRFDATSLGYYIQFLDPELLRHDLLRSLLYLRDQPPLFNGFLGLVLKAAPAHPERVFAAIYHVLGVAFGGLLYALAARAGVRPWLAALVALLMTSGPIAVLYENWLFYTFPLAVLLCGAAVALHRYLDGGRPGDGVVCFSLLALLVWTRNLLHPLWMLAAIAGLLAIERGRRRAVARVAAVPVLLVVALMAKQWIWFGTIFQGRALQQMNLAVMSSMRLPEEERARLVAVGTLRISDLPIISEPSQLRARTGLAPARTGVPALDREHKAGGAPNWNHPVYVAAGELYGADARWALRAHPRLYLAAVGENLARYLQPSDESDPFNTRRWTNRVRLQPLLTAWNAVLGGKLSRRGPALLHWIGMPALLGLCAVRLLRVARRGGLHAGAPGRATELTLAFALYTTLWISAATVLLSYGDHNRYRFKVSAFYCLFVALALEEALRRLGRPLRTRRTAG